MYGFTIEPVLWSITYPVNPYDPIGWIRHEQGEYRATLESEDLGMHPTGDAAAEAVWERYLEKARVEHEAASRVHGSNERDGHRPHGVAGRPNNPPSADDDPQPWSTNSGVSA